MRSALLHQNLKLKKYISFKYICLLLESLQKMSDCCFKNPCGIYFFFLQNGFSAVMKNTFYGDKQVMVGVCLLVPYNQTNTSIIVTEP